MWEGQPHKGQESTSTIGDSPSQEGIGQPHKREPDISKKGSAFLVLPKKEG